MTVVFSDLTGSTALGERLDPESLSRVMSRSCEAVRAVVLHQGGTVERFAGDDPVDPRLLVALTEALAATFDPGYH